MKDVRIRKKKLKDDLELLEGNFEERIQSTKRRILGPLKPVSYIKSKPFLALGAALAAGIILGFSSKKKNNSKEIIEDRKSSDKSPAFTGILIDELKKIAAKRAANYLSELVDQKLSEKNKSD